MDITRAAIEKNRITLVALLVIYAAGLSAYLSLPRAEDPGFTIRTAVVVTYFFGASPERVELLVSDKLEKVIQQMPELDNVRSENKTGISVITVNIKESYTQMRPIWDSLRRKVDGARSELPEGVVGPFVNDEFGDVFGTIVTVSGSNDEEFSYAELKEIADQVRDQLLRLNDVAKVEMYGAQDERVFVEYNNARLAELGLSPLQLQDILANRNIIIPGGDIFTGRERISLEPSGNFESVEDLRRTVVKLPGSEQVLYLQDLVEIRRGYVEPPETLMTSSGAPSIGLAVSLREGGNIISLGDEVKALVDRLQNAYPIGIDLDIAAFQPAVVEKKVSDFIGNVFQAVGVVVLVMLAMLGLRTGLVIASLIPSAIVMSLMFMSFLGIGLDQLSLTSLIIALGMLVDNAIVMSESIMVQMAAGKDRIEAAVDSARELRIPLLTSSLTTAAAFLPIYLAESSTGEYTAPLFKVVTITLLCSWMLALTMIPLLCVMFLKVKRVGKEGGSGRFYRFYRSFLIGILRFRFPALLLTGGAFALAVYGLGFVPQIFFPPSDTPMMTAELRFPTGTAIEHNARVVQAVDDYIGEELTVSKTRPEGVTRWTSYIGQGAPRFVLSYNPEQTSPDYSILVINATSRRSLTELVEKLEAFCQRFPEVEATVAPLPLGPMIKNPVEVRLAGEDPDRLYAIAQSVKDRLNGIRGAKNVSDDWGRRTKKLLVRIDEPRARRSGITNQDIAISLLTVLSGFETTDYREEDRVIPITLRSVAADRQDIGKLESLNVYSQATGDSVPLKQVAEIEVVWQPAKIFRRDRLKTITIASDLVSGVTAREVVSELVPWLEAVKSSWGIGYFYELGGEEETSGKANQSIAEKLPIAALIIILLLVAQFNSIRRPVIILLTIPLGLIGVTVGLLVADSYFGFMTLLGIISLAGIVINNAIVLLDRIRIEIEENGLDPPRAVIEASQRRLRPILLTTMTTLGGLVPLWLGGGPMFEPMAISIIFGLALATLLTLGVVPVLYSILFRVRFKGFSY